MLLELVATKGSHTGLDASCAQSNEDEAHHGEGAEGNSSTSTQQDPAARLGEPFHLVYFDSAYTWKVMLSGFPSMFVSVMSWMALTARTTCPNV